MEEPAERSLSPGPTIEELVSRLTQWSTTVVETQALVVKSKTEPVVTIAAEKPAATQVEEEAPAEAGLVDIASILDTPTITIVRSSL
jgi:hypothetical protein